MTAPIRKLPDAYMETAIDEEVVVMSLASGDFFTLEDTARAIWLLIDGTRDHASIVAALEADYGPQVDPDEVRAFLAELDAAGFVAA